jgi:DNA-binding MarR family transcriptional regulator
MLDHVTTWVNTVQVWTIPRMMPGLNALTPRWLSEPEQRAWRAFAMATQLLFDQLDRELQRDAGISHAYYAILVALSDHPERTIRMTDLARLLRYSKTRLSEAIARLETRGWVSRQPCPSDRRSTYAILTDAGFAALEAAAPGHVEGVRRHVFDRLTPEQVGQLGSISEAILNPLLEAAGFDPDACPGGFA